MDTRSSTVKVKTRVIIMSFFLALEELPIHFSEISRSTRFYPDVFSLHEYRLMYRSIPPEGSIEREREREREREDFSEIQRGGGGGLAASKFAHYTCC